MNLQSMSTSHSPTSKTKALPLLMRSVQRTYIFLNNDEYGTSIRFTEIEKGLVWDFLEEAKEQARKTKKVKEKMLKTGSFRRASGRTDDLQDGGGQEMWRFDAW